MISVMNDFEIDRKPASTPDLSFFGMESPKEEEWMDPIERETTSSLDPLSAESRDLVRVSPVTENQQRQRVPPRVSDPEPELDDEEHVGTNGFAAGDMVWGKVKSHPWWPGHIFNEAFAWPSVRRAKRDDNVLVAFFGDSSYGWFDPAELIPFEPHFVEKSRQTTLRSFVRAVEESIDETGRRAALGLACRCQNPYNFRPAGVANYYKVDVVGYERNGIYSRRQINRERESFDAKEMVGFLHQLAVMPRGSEAKDVEWHRNEALALAVRRRRYEEFDETYAQAFGQTPVRPAINEMGVPEQAERFARRVAPLSGPLVEAEPLGDKEKSKHHSSFAPSKASSSSSSSSHKHKHKSSKKNKYVLKRRDDRPAASAVSPPLPDAFVLDDSAAAMGGPASDYVLQKREPASDGQNHNAGSPQTPPMPADSDDNVVDGQPATYAALPVDVGVVKERKIKKRPLEADDIQEGAKTEKKKKIKKLPLDATNSQEEAKTEKHKKKKKLRDDGFGHDLQSVSKKSSSSSSSAEVSRASETSADPPRPVSPPSADLPPLDQLDLPSVLADLQSLALDPFFGVNRNAPSITRHVFVRFRSLIYTKSLVVPAPGDSDEVQASKPAAASSAVPIAIKEAKEQQQQQQKRDQGSSSSSKPAVKLMKRPDDPTRAGRKRAPSDRQEEMLAKRTKKVSKLKSLASERKSLLGPKPSPEAQKGNNGTITAAALGPSAVEPARKQEKQELPPSKRESPTYLFMKFPPRSTLPSVSNLKARFARFGPLEVDGTRVFWKSHSCRVLFKNKSDAAKAFSYVKGADLFGQIPVEYTVKEVEGPAPEPEPPRRQPDPQADGGMQFRPGNGGGAQPRPQQPHGRLKSILKKPGEEAAKESQRVKFLLSGSDSPPSASGNGASFADVAPAQPMRAPKSALHWQPLMPPPQMPPPVESRGPPTPQWSPPWQEQRYGGGGEMEGRDGDGNVDISHQMLSLLMRCSDIVTGLRSLPGFVPYRPL